MSVRSLVWDNHGCMPFEEPDRWLPELARYRRSGVDVVMINIGDGKTPLEDCIRMAAEVRRFVITHPEEYAMALTVDETRGGPPPLRHGDPGDPRLDAGSDQRTESLALWLRRGADRRVD